MADSTVVFISGVSKGIGRALAQIYLSRPNHIVIGSVRDSTTPEVAELKSSPTAGGTKLLLVHIESTSADDPKKALEEIQAAGIDRIDTVIANAGGSPPVVPLESVGTQDLITAYLTNAAGPLLLFQTLRPLLQKSKSPKWIVISSTGGSVGTIGKISSFITPAYGASKAALNWLTVAIHFSQEWLTVVAIHPGLVQTGPGNWVARQVGLEQAPTTIEESATKIVKTTDEATRETTSGKFISVVEGTELPW